MTDKPLMRPRQATVSGWLILAGSIVIVLLAFQQVSTLGSIEAQQAAEDLISNPPGKGLGLSVDDVQRILRVVSFVAAAAGTAAAILGWQVLQRSRSARLALSLLAPVLLVSGLAVGGFSAALVAAAVAMLWVQPSRDWFAGREPAVRPSAAAPSTSGVTLAPRAPVPPAPQTPSAWDLAPPTPTPAPGPGASASPHAAQTSPALTYEAPNYLPSMKRPRQVTVACLIAIVSSAIAFASIGISLLYLLLSRATVIVEIEKELKTASYDGFTADSVANVAIGFFAVLLVWALVAIGLAVATLRRSNGARITLVVSALLSAVVSLLGVLVVVPLAFTAAGVVAAMLLLGRDARAWFVVRG